MRCQTLPEGDAPISTAGQHPGVRRSLGFGAHTHVRIQAKAQQEAAQQGGVVLTVPLWRTDSEGPSENLKRGISTQEIHKTYYHYLIKCMVAN